MKPWVGKYYKYGFLGYNDQGKIIEGIKEHPGRRILILADSMLVQPEETPLETSELIQAYINLSQDEKRYFRTFIRFEGAFSGSTLSQDGVNNFWNHLALYHFNGVITSLGQQTSVEQNYGKFTSVLNELKPDIVIVWGLKLCRQLALSAEEITDTINTDYSGVNANIYQRRIKGKAITFIPIAHPGSLYKFRVNEYHDFFTKALPKVSGGKTPRYRINYYKMAYAWDKFLRLCSSPICKKWTIDDFDHFVKYLWFGINGRADTETRRRNSLKDDDSIVIINSSYTSVDNGIIYLMIRLTETGEYIETVDVILSEELQKFGVIPDHIPSINMPKTIPISELYLDKILSKRSKKNGQKFEGGSRGHLIVDGIDNFPLSYRLSKYSRFCKEPTKDVSSQEQLDLAITRELQLKLKKFVNELTNEKKDNLPYTILQEIYSDLLESIRNGFDLLREGKISPAIYYNADREQNVAFPLFNSNGYPICVVTNRIKNRNVGIIMPMTLLSMDEIRIDTWTYGDSQYDQPDWLKPGYRLPEDEK